MKERNRRGMIGSRWENERKEFFEERGVRIEEVEEMREVEEDWFKERQRRERWEKIGESNYNRWYKVIKEEGVPEYLRKGWGESRWNRVARFRLGNEVREGRYWEEEEKRLCRRCGGEIESWEHVWERCRDWGGDGKSTWQEEVGRILGGRERGNGG